MSAAAVQKERRDDAGVSDRTTHTSSIVLQLTSTSRSQAWNKPPSAAESNTKERI